MPIPPALDGESARLELLKLPLRFTPDSRDALVSRESDDELCCAGDDASAPSDALRCDRRWSGAGLAWDEADALAAS